MLLAKSKLKIHWVVCRKENFIVLPCHYWNLTRSLHSFLMLESFFFFKFLPQRKEGNSICIRSEGDI